MLQIHDKDTNYTWSGPSYGTTNVMDGTITGFLTVLNAGAGFAGHTDWRIPNVKELQSIVNYEIPYPGPTVDAAFHQSATCSGCTDVNAATCSCTASDVYWSSTTYRSARSSRGSSPSATATSSRALRAMGSEFERCVAACGRHWGRAGEAIPRPSCF